MTLMGTDIESIEILDFEFEPPCEYGTLNNGIGVEPDRSYTDCDRPAAWSLLTACGLNLLFCQVHFDRQLDYVNKYGSELGKCPHCGHEVPIKDYIVQATRL